MHPTRCILICVLASAAITVCSAQTLHPPPAKTMKLGGFYLGMSQADIRALLNRSSIQLNQHRYGRDYDSAIETYPSEYTFGVDTPDSVSCLGPNVPHTSSRQCIFFDSITVWVETPDFGVHGIHLWTTGFPVSDAEEFRDFTAFILTRLTEILGKPHQIVLRPYDPWAKPGEITESFLSEITSDDYYTVATWQWRDPYDDYYHLVICGASIHFYKGEDGKCVLVVSMYIPLCEEE